MLEYAKAADLASKEYDVDVLFVAPYTEIRRVREHTEHLLVLAPYMDAIRPGRGIAAVLPEAIKAAGAQGVVLNHSERPMSLSSISRTIELANKLDMLTFVCAATITEAQALAYFHPDIINPEETELIGSGMVSDTEFIKEAKRAVHSVDHAIHVEHAAGITTARQVYDFILEGADGVGSSSGILTSSDPHGTLHEMVRSVSRAKEDLAKKIV